MRPEVKLRKLPEWIKRTMHYLRSIRVPGKIVYLLISVLATIWFLVRVIPKPSRATYPCMQVAYPFMSGMVIWILTFTGSVFALKNAKPKLMDARYLAAVFFLVIGLGLSYIFTSQSSTQMALDNNPPSGTVYDPERDGTKLNSLGVTEHWNNPADKKYTRNLKTGKGIELVYKKVN